MPLSLRELEAASIRGFLEGHRELIRGQVLDFGAGQQPYRYIVEAAGAEYVPHDNPGYPGSTATESTKRELRAEAFDTVICTQVLQYVGNPEGVLRRLYRYAKPNGWLLLTGPTNWPIVEREDLWRFTPEGVRHLLRRSGWRGEQVSPRADVTFEGERWTLGWAATAQKQE